MLDRGDAGAGAIHGKTPADRLLKGMNALVAHRNKGLVFYTQSPSRMTIVRNHLVPPFGAKKIYEDCSSAVTGLYRMAGLHDPNDLHFSGQGYTGTLCLHGRPVQRPYKVGDLVFYGSGGPPWHHVAIVYSISKTGKVTVWSHGHPGGPELVPLDYRSDRGQVRRYIPWKS